jgi:hypothetical protein
MMFASPIVSVSVLMQQRRSDDVKEPSAIYHGGAL